VKHIDTFQLYKKGANDLVLTAFIFLFLTVSPFCLLLFYTFYTPNFYILLSLDISSVILHL